MIGRVVKIQLVLFLVLTVVGVSFAGARYAGLSALFGDDEYHVGVDLAESGGIFEGADVTYRGVSVGQVDDLELTTDGVRVRLALADGTRVPADTDAVVENRSAIGEQYVDLQPRRSGGPYLRDGATIARERTETPIPTTELLSNLNQLVDSVDDEELTTVIEELGQAFVGTGGDLQRLIDSGNAFIETADENLTETIQLIEDGTTVLRTQADAGDHISSFATDLADLSDTLVDSDEDLRTVLDSGRATARQLDALIDDVSADVPVLLANTVTAGQIVRDRLDGVQQLLITYPYVVRGGYTVIDSDPGTGHYTTHFGLQLALGPSSCDEGYEQTERREPSAGEGAMNTEAHCADEDTNHRGAQNAPAPNDGSTNPEAVPEGQQGEGAATGERTPDAGDGGAGGETRGAPARIGSLGGQQRRFGEESWKWLLMGPMTQ